MNLSDWAGLVVSVLTIVGSLVATIKFLVKHYLKELKPNGGSSLRDEQNRQGDAIGRLEVRIDSIYELVFNLKK